MVQVAAFRIDGDENGVASYNGDELYAALRGRGYCIVRIALEPDTERTKRLLSWQSSFRAAFQQSQSVKEAVGGYRADHGVAVGYRREDQREFFETRLKREVGSIDPSFPDVQDYDQTVVDMFACLSGAAAKVLVAVLGAAGLDPKSILDLTDLCEEKGYGVPDTVSALVPSSSLLRVCSYPTDTCDMTSSEIQFGAHTDTSFLTVGPISSVAGLEVFDPLERCWLAVEECPEARAGPCELSTVVFVGEFLQVLTRAHFKALIHRVRAPSAGASTSSTRHSCPLIIRGRNLALIDLANTVKYVHQPRGSALLADLDGVTMRQLHRLLDIKRQRVVQKPRGPGEPWVLMAYPEMDPTRENAASAQAAPGPTPAPAPGPAPAPAVPSHTSLSLSLVLLVGYTFYSVLKRSFHAAMNPIARDLQLSKALIGSTASAFAIAYGVSKLFGGAITDKGRVAASALFAGGLVLGGACNVLMANASSPYTLMAAWAVNGLVQGASQPALQALVSQLVPSRGQASVWSILLCASNVGYLISPLVLIPTSETVGWRTAIGGCGVVGVALGLIVWLVLSADRAQGSVGPRGNVADPGTSTSNAVGKEQELKGSGYRLFPSSLVVSSLLVASGLTLMVLKSLADWTPLYLAEGWGLSAVEAAQLAALSEIGGILGSLLCGPACDLWLGGDVLAASALGAVLCGAACLALRLPRQGGAGLVFESASGIWTGTGLGLRIGLFLAGFFVNFPKTLLPLVMSSTAPKGRAGALAGLLGLAGQVGGTLSGSGAALMIESWGWESFAWALHSCSWLVAAVLWGSRLGKTRDCQRGSFEKED